MDFTLYNLLLSQLSERPDLRIVQNRQPVPEAWPLVLHSFQTFRKQIQAFTVSDGRHTATIVSRLTDVYDRVATMEVGTIIHLIGSEALFDNDRNCYVLDVQDVLTLKSYDERLKEIRQAEEERLARLEAEGYFQAFSTVEY
jgi:hypothetical protein